MSTMTGVEPGKNEKPAPARNRNGLFDEIRQIFEKTLASPTASLN